MNPFTPGFGKVPEVLVGRKMDLEDFAFGIEEGPGAPERAMLFTGLRGSGKTVMLKKCSDIAESKGWVTLRETASKDTIHSLTEEKIPDLLNRYHPDAKKLKADLGVDLGILKGSFSHEDQLFEQKLGLESLLRVLVELEMSHGAGVLITLDEVADSNTDYLSRLFDVVQHLVTDDLDIAIVFAGLQTRLNKIFDKKSGVTFLHRADHRICGQISDADVAYGLEEPAKLNGKTWDPEGLAAAVEAINGYPYLIQLVGHQAWRLSGDDDVIQKEVAFRAISHAQRRIGSQVHGPELAALSDVDRAFLTAMAQDMGTESRTSDIAERMGISTNESQYIGKYRKRLIDAGLISPGKHGYVKFADDTLAQYIRDYIPYEAMGGQ